MNRNFIFVFILLVTFSIVNAVPSQLRKRVTTFEPCPVGTPPVLDVYVVPDPLILGEEAKFHISGTLPKAIPKGAMVSLSYFDTTVADDPKLIDTHSLGICTPDGGVLDCPYAAQLEFRVIYTDGSVPILPTQYGILF